MPPNGFNQSSDSRNVNQSCKSLTLSSNDENPNVFVLPVGTVKRQVESINFKNKSMSQFSNEMNDLFNGPETSTTKTNSDITLDATQQSTTSPDSKRFKCELLKKAATDYEFNRTKKVFENLEDDIKKQPTLQQKNNARIVSSLSFKLFSGEQQK